MYLQICVHMYVLNQSQYRAQAGAHGLTETKTRRQNLIAHTLAKCPPAATTMLVIINKLVLDAKIARENECRDPAPLFPVPVSEVDDHVGAPHKENDAEVPSTPVLDRIANCNAKVTGW